MSFRNNKWTILITSLILLSISLIYFNPKLNVFAPKYDQKLDSIFLGLNFGMTSQQFFDVCFQLNKEGKAIQGTQNTSVLYIDNDNFKLPVDMNFYPQYHDDKIFAMPVYFNYKAWAPWNRELQSDSLILEVKLVLEKWYGKGFKEKKLPSGRIGYYKVDKPRIISVKMRDEQFVDVLIENIKYAPKKDDEE